MAQAAAFTFQTALGIVSDVRLSTDDYLDSRKPDDAVMMGFDGPVDLDDGGFLMRCRWIGDHPTVEITGEISGLGHVRLVAEAFDLIATKAARMRGVAEVG